MKLLCVTPSYFPAFQYGGPIGSVHGLNKGLVKRGTDVTVYSTNVGLYGKVPVNQEIDVDGVKVIYFGFVNLFEFVGRSGWQLSRQMTNALRRNLKQFDVIHLHAIWNYPTAVAAYYCRRYKKPYIIAPRGSLYPYAIGKNAWKKWIYYTLIAKRDIQGASAIHFTTEDELERCHSFLGLRNEAIIVPNGIDIFEFENLPGRNCLSARYPLLNNKKVILFLGRIHWKKGLDLLAKAYGKLTRERGDVHLLIVGPDEGQNEKKVREWLKAEGVLERVTFTGMLTGKEKLETYAGCTLFVLPSYSENFGMAVIEAMTCGLPVVISDQVGIHREVAKDSAGLVVNCDSEQLAQAMIKLLDDTDLSQRMGKNGRRLVNERFTLDKIATKMIEAYERVISSN